MFESLLLAATLVIPPPEAAPAVAAAKADASKRFGVATELARIERVTWRDGSLGCPRKDMASTQALVPGWRMTLVAGKRRLDYHASESGTVVYCPPGRSEQPLPDSKT